MAIKITTPAEVAAAMSGKAQQQLKAAWDDLLANFPKGVSSTSTSKYTPIRDQFSSWTGISAADIYATGAADSRTSNLDTRLVQGNQVSRHTRLGLAFIQKAASVEDIAKQSNSAEVTSKKFLGPGNAEYDGIAIVIEYNGDPLVTKIIERSANPISPVLAPLFPHAEVVQFSDPSSSPYPVGSVAVPFAAASPASVPLDLPLNLILYGPPGCGKTYRITDELVPHFTDGDGDRFRFITFHPAFTYEEFVEGIKPVADGGHVTYDTVPGVFRAIADEARGKPKPYAIFIDEINRGNVPSIFGDLISIVEESRREKTAVVLPYSRDPFTVPKNLYVIGTMNTADRSTATIDIALRRRFQFEELRPDLAFLEEHLKSKGVPDAMIDGVNVPDLLEALNDRLEYLVDRDHVIGHSFFMDCRSFGDIVEVFHHQIIPLLQEYFAEDWRRLCYALGESPTLTGPLDFIDKDTFTSEREKKLFGEPLDHFEPKTVYEIRPREAWTPDHFKRLITAAGSSGSLTGEQP